MRSPQQVPFENRVPAMMEGFDIKNQVYAISRNGWVTEKPLYQQNNYNYGSMSALTNPMNESFMGMNSFDSSDQVNQIIKHNFHSNM